MPRHSSIFGLHPDSPAAISRRAILPLAAVLLTFAGTIAGRAAAFQTKVPYALLLDASSGQVLFEKRADRALILASHSFEIIREFCDRAMVLHAGAGVMYSDVNEALDVYTAL